MLTINYPCKSLEDFVVGQIIERTFEIGFKELQSFIEASGDIHPLHTNNDFAKSKGYPNVLIHGMAVAARCSAFIAEEFVGLHGLLISMSVDFRTPIFCGDQLYWHAEVIKIDVNGKTVEVKWNIFNNKKLILQRGTACTYLGNKK